MTRSERPKGVDLFCGVGGMSLGFEQAGFDVVAGIDIDQINVDSHSKNFPSCRTTRIDLATTNAAHIRTETGIGDSPLAVVFAGPPCQGFSLIGNRILNDPRNLLLHELARLIGELAPSYFVVENVAGILLGETKSVMSEFLCRVRAAGYLVVEPVQVLNAADFGVPQRRRRVFILGYRKGLVAPKYPAGVANGDGDGPHPNVWEAIGDLPSVDKYDYLVETDEYRGDLGDPSHYAKVLRGEVSDPDDKAPRRNRNGNGLGGCLRTLHTPEIVSRFKSTRPGTNEPVSRYHRLSKTGLCPTIRAGTGPAQGSFMAARPIHPVDHRCITVREAARLHSFPDWFMFHATKWHGFRQIGNSVPPRLARVIARSVAEALKTSMWEG
jgi:DNA (cytosine-5)-methyltransferase 1